MGYTGIWPREVLEVPELLDELKQKLGRPGVDVLYRDQIPYHVGQTGRRKPALRWVGIDELYLGKKQKFVARGAETLKAAGNDRLSGTRYDWLRHPARMEPKDQKEFAQSRNSGLKTARAWALKETGMALFSFVYERPARRHFRSWHNWAVRSRLKPIIEVGRMLKRRVENIITYLRQRVTNAASESINAKIQWVKHTVRGFSEQTELRPMQFTSTAVA